MKLITKLLTLVAMAASVAGAGSFFTGEEVVNKPTQSYSTTFDVDTRDVDRLTAQAIYSSATISPTTLTFDDGRKSTATLTILYSTTAVAGLSGLRIAINGYVIDEGVHWTKTTNVSSDVAKAISDAIVARPGLSGIVTSTWTMVATSSVGVVFATSTAVGSDTNYTLFSSKDSTATWSASEMVNGDASGVNLTDDSITFAGPHGVSTGFPIWLQTVSGTAPTGLTAGTTYYAIKKNDVAIYLANSSTMAIAGTPVNITAVTGSGSFKFNPTAFAGTYSFKWQATLDGTNFSDVNVSSITYSTPGNTLWDFGDWNYKKLRLNFVAGTGGGLDVRAVISGTKD